MRGVSDDTGRMVYSAPETHYCRLRGGNENEGDVWRCGTCGAYWQYRKAFGFLEWRELRRLRLLAWQWRMWRREQKAGTGR